MEKKGYYLGLDMGTNSVGWAVTDKSYNIIRAKGKDLWGIREFEEAKTAESRRIKRIARRRRQRELVRRGHLKEYFADAIEEIDPNFYARLDNSKYWEEDKEYGHNVLFNDENYTDKNYYEKYPTIFHLRSELIHNPKPHDVRLVYLAILNIFKHRGHFLSNASSAEGDLEIKELYFDFKNKIMAETGIEFSNFDTDEFEKIIISTDCSRMEKHKKLCEIMYIKKGDEEYKIKNELVKLICGLKTDAKNIFPEITEELEDEKEKIEIDFQDAEFDEQADALIEKIGEEKYEIIAAGKAIYDAALLKKIRRDKDYLSDARVADYEKHKADLTLLKSVIRNMCGEDAYNKMFRSCDKGTYSAYVKSENSGEKVRRRGDGRKIADLYKTIRSMINSAEETEEIKKINSEMDNETFLPKQLTASNGVIPNQIHEKELKAILKNAEGYLPFLKEKDESGLTVSERIIKLFTFHIPYYIGPLSEKSAENNGNGWVVRKASGEVLPWNLEEKVDIHKTAEIFIDRLIRKCTYIGGEKVVPKESLIYEKFTLLNILNNIKINGVKIDVDLKQDIYKNLYEKGEKVTYNSIANYLVCLGKIKDEKEIAGIDGYEDTKFPSFGTYGKFNAIFGEKFREKKYQKITEQIVELMTIYGDSKKLVKERLKKDYGDILTEQEMKRILGLKFKDWGRVSRSFIELPGYEKYTNESISLIGALWTTQYNLMELINSDRFTFREELEKKKKTLNKTLSEFKPEDLSEYYFSAPVKRMIWQTILVIEEIIHVMGYAPDRIFVEVTRSGAEKSADKDKNRTTSRKKKFLDLYKNIKDESKNWKDVIEKADESGIIRSKKMYLYLTQTGRCMYTGEKIPLNELFDDNKYDIDHIYPQHFVTDNNLDNNMVLVKKEENAHKSDGLIKKSVQSNPKIKELWKRLLDAKLINNIKYNRLKRSEPLTDEDKAGFIDRQLVETSQATKSVMELLKQLLSGEKTEFVYSKACNVSDFRQQFDIPKSRLVNDFHHAHDAYLNIVVGNTYHVKFTKDTLKYVKNEKNQYHMGKVFYWDVIRDNEIAWKAPEITKDDSGLKTVNYTGTIATVRKMLKKNTPLLTRMPLEDKGSIANETLYSKDKAKEKIYIPFKFSDPKIADVKKYGGFTAVNRSYFFLVEHELKGKRVRTLETVPVYMREKIEHNPEELEKYCTDELGLKNPSIRMRKIKMQSFVRFNDYYGLITGITGNNILVRNNVSLYLSKEETGYIAHLERIAEKGIKIADDKENDKDTEENGKKSEKFTVTREKNISIYNILILKPSQKQMTFSNFFWYNNINYV